MEKVVRRLLLVREVWVQTPSRSNLPYVANDSPPCNLDVWVMAKSRGVGHRSLVTPKRILSEYNGSFGFYLLFIQILKL